MSTADDILDQIDIALGDYAVSDDAMRWAPDEPTPHPGPPASRGREILISRLIERHGLDVDAAAQAVLAAERGQTGAYTELAAIEARVVVQEMVQRIRFAFQPMAEAAIATLRQRGESLKQLQIEPAATASPPNAATVPPGRPPTGRHNDGGEHGDAPAPHPEAAGASRMPTPSGR